MPKQIPSSEELVLMSQRYSLDADAIREIMRHLETIVFYESSEYALGTKCIHALQCTEEYLCQIACEIDRVVSMVDGPTYSVEQLKDLHF